MSPLPSLPSWVSGPQLKETLRGRCGSLVFSQEILSSQAVGPTLMSAPKPVLKPGAPESRQEAAPGALARDERWLGPQLV